MSQKLQPGDGYTFTSNGRNVSLEIDQPGRRRHPLEVFSNPNNGNPAVSVFPGSVNGVMPKISGDYLDAETRPKLNISTTGFIYVKATRQEGEPFPKNVTIEFASTVPEDTNASGHFAIASIIKTGNTLKINQLISSSLMVSRQGYGESEALFYWFNV